MTPRLRRATHNDLSRLLMLVRRYHDGEGIDLTDEARLAAVTPLLGDSPAGRLWLIEAEAAVVGYVALCFGYSIEFGGRDAFVDEFYILDAYRGRGFGRSTLAAVRREAVHLGVRALHLEVSRTNGRAQRLYTSLGYTVRDYHHLMTLRLV